VSRGATASGLELIQRLGALRPDSGLVEPDPADLLRHSRVIQAAHRFKRERGEAPDAVDEAVQRALLPPFMRPKPFVRLPAPQGLTPRWYELRPHAQQFALWNSPARFIVVPAGRRSGKTELAMRRLVLGCLIPPHAEARYFAAAPTWQQAKRIFWQHLKALSPRRLVVDISDGDLWIKFITGAVLQVVGLDVPARIEGSAWDGGVLDEYANMSDLVWSSHLRPIMAERGGWCWFIGVPEGRNHYHKLYLEARKRENRAEWQTFTWWSEDILPAEEVEKAKRDMPEEMFEQEFHASFRSFKGRVYKAFDELTHTAPLLHLYDPDRPLVLMFDFNVEPGAAVVAQEMLLPSGHVGTGVIGEVHIPYDSDTLAVCRKLVSDWGGHRGPILVYGDATGGQRRAEGVLGHNWKLVKQGLRNNFVGKRIVYKVPLANAAVRAGINCMNARLRSADGVIRLMVDPVHAPAVVLDLEGVRYLEGGSGEIAKTGKANYGLTHWTEALRDYVVERFPIRGYDRQGGFQPVELGGEAA
jgi:hypothetical protein